MAQTPSNPICRNIAVVGAGYVGLSLAVLLSQHNNVTVVDIDQQRVEVISAWQSPFRDDCMERWMSEAASGVRSLSLAATTNAEAAYVDADYVVVAAPTDYDPQKGLFDTNIVEDVLERVVYVTAGRDKSGGAVNHRASKPTIVIKSTVPVGFTERMRGKFPGYAIVFSPEFLREG